MITEDYVSFETAKLMKEKGFNEYCKSVYHVGSICSVASLGYHYNEGYGAVVEEKQNSDFGKYDNAISAPTLQMAMKWLREVQQISVEALPDWFDSNHTNIHDGWYCEVRYLTNMSYDADYFEHKKYDSYEKAVEAAIKYCLENLI